MTVAQEPIAPLQQVEPHPVSQFRPSRALAVLAAATVALSPLNGYLRMLSPQLGKLLPALMFLAWIGGLIRERRWPRLHLISLLALILMGLMFMSSASNSEDSYRLDYVIRWLPFLLLAICFVDIFSTRVHPRVAVYAASVGAVCAGAGALYSFIFLGDTRATGPMEDPNDLAYVLTCAVPLLIFGPGRSPRRGVRGLAYLGVAISVAGALVTVSRGGIFALTVILIWALWRRLVSIRVMVAGVIAGLAVAGAAVTFAAPLLDTALQQKSYIGARNVQTRTLRWEAALRELKEHPVLGVGPGGNRAHYVEFGNNAEIDEQSPVTHNMYIEVGSELGLLAFCCFIGMMITAVFVLIHPYPPDRNLALAIQGSLLALATSSTFLSEEYYMPLWMGVSVAGALDLRRRTKRTR